jgi:hypothetical protein
VWRLFQCKDRVGQQEFKPTLCVSILLHQPKPGSSWKHLTGSSRINSQTEKTSKIFCFTESFTDPPAMVHATRFVLSVEQQHGRQRTRSSLKREVELIQQVTEPQQVVAPMKSNASTVTSSDRDEPASHVCTSLSCPCRQSASGRMTRSPTLRRQSLTYQMFFDMAPSMTNAIEAC